MIDLIKVDATLSDPKYQQIIDSIIAGIDQGQIKKGEKLPSINEVCIQKKLSRDTVLNAYYELKERGIISPQHGKGFFISSTKVNAHKKIFMLFDTMNNYKEILYRSFRNSIGPNVTIDIYFHYYNLEIFETLISENIGRYSHYVVMPHFNSDVTALLKKIPLEKLLIIDKNVANLQGDYACVYQNFEEDIYEALQTGNVLLKKYKKFNLILHDGFQFIPEGIILGYKKFCKNFGFDGKLIEHLPKGVIRKGEAYLAISDMDMIGVIKSAQEKDWILGENIGLISYDDTPIKEVLAGGVTVLSTDFESMGRLAAELILSKKKAQIRNSFSLIKRRSL